MIQNQFIRLVGCTHRFDLIYRSSRDGFHSKNFHWKCDGKGPTFCLIKSKTGIISGGYTPIEWTSDKNWEVRDKR